MFLWEESQVYAKGFMGGGDGVGVVGHAACVLVKLFMTKLYILMNKVFVVFYLKEPCVSGRLGLRKRRVAGRIPTYQII